MLIISVPALTWADINGGELPNLARFLDEAAIGTLATRTLTAEGSLSDGYAALGAGARGIGTGTPADGKAFEVGETFEGELVGEVFTRRTDRAAVGGLVHLGIAGITDANASPRFDGQIGALGEALDEAGWSRAVIANADGLDVTSDDYYRRHAVATLMDPGGRVPQGSLGFELLVHDTGAPLGLRYDTAAVAAALREVWRPRSVVLVEASDLVRADVALQLAPTAVGARLWREALRGTDRLVGALMAEVDRERDAVVVVGPTHPRSGVRLTVAALRAPGVQAGLLRSPTTGRFGFVSLVDIAPTVLEQTGLDQPDSMEGRPFQTGKHAGSAAHRRSLLADADAAARFRDDHAGRVTVAFVAVQALLAVGTCLWLRRPERPRLRRALRVVALAALGYIPAVYLARLVAFHEGSAFWYWAFLVTVALALSALDQLTGRRTPLGPPMVALGVIAMIVVLDVIVGARLQFLSPLGYSPKVAGRFGGLGNLGFSALASASVLLTALIPHRIKGPAGVRLAVAMLAGVVVVVGAPWWGANVGGVLSALPAFAVTTWLLLGRKIRPRVVALFALSTVAAVIVFGLIDVARPPENRTHLGRLFEHVVARGWPALQTVILRKLDENLSALTNSVWLAMMPIVVGFAAYLYLRRRERLLALFTGVPELCPALIGFAVLAVLSFALNDTGIALPGLMLGVLNATMVILMVTQPTSPAPASAAVRRADATAGHHAPSASAPILGSVLKAPALPPR